MKNNNVICLKFVQNWSKQKKYGSESWPEKRAYHAACCLNFGEEFPQLLVTGGLSVHNKPLRDAWILDIEGRKWRQVRLKLNAIACIASATSYIVFPSANVTLLFRQQYRFVSILMLPTHLKTEWCRFCHGIGPLML